MMLTKPVHVQAATPAVAVPAAAAVAVAAAAALAAAGAKVHLLFHHHLPTKTQNNFKPSPF